MKGHLIALTIPGYGQVQTPDGVPSNVQPSGLIAVGLNVAFVMGILLALAYLVYGGIFWLQSGGDKTKLDKARRTIIYAIVGLIVMSLAAVVVNTILVALGIRNPL